MTELFYPSNLSKPMPVFLGGSTAKGDWQKKVVAAFEDTHIPFINTSRPDWDVVEPNREQKNEHIAWEFNWQKRVLNHFICIPADAKSPTVMLELGLAISCHGNAVVFIDPEYSHFHNARIACETYGVRVFTDFDEAVEKLKDLFLTSRLF
ncbi:hypothetical protein [Xanthomonas phage X1]|nr:hypothetical protein [Xanthomonas phage X1]